MSQEFDPYHRWLGIPPEEQPANHYRLLGLVQLESDVEVIRDAAERQIGHVRRYGLGKHSELSQRILNELAAAKACLQDPERKSEYDAQLRKKLKASKPQPAQEPKKEVPQVFRATELPPPPSRMPPELPGRLPDTVPAAMPQRAEVPATGGSVLKWIAVGGGAAAGLVLAVSLAVYVAWHGKEGGQGKVPPAAGRLSPEPASRPVEQPRPRPPKLAKIPDQSAEEGRTVEVKAEVADRGTAPGDLLFGLVQGPQGAMVDAEAGVFRWTPGPGQAGVKHLVTLQVAAREASELAGRATFTISVQEASLLPPRLQSIPEREVEAGGKLEFVVKASDPNQPPRKLEYALVDPPAWGRIDARSGTVTLKPPEDDRGGSYHMLVRVTSDTPKALSVEGPLGVVVTPRAQPSEDMGNKTPEPPDLSGLAEIKGLSGSLNPVLMDVRQTAMASAQNLVQRADSDPKVMPLFAGTFGGPVAAVCELNKATNKLDGVVVAFQPGRDPLTCLDAKMRTIVANMPRTTTRRVTPFGMAPGMSAPVQGAMSDARAGAMGGQPAEESGTNETADDMGSMGLNSMQMATARMQALQTFWADVRLNGCLQFKQGTRHGAAATWEPDGQRAFWGNYERGKRHDFCCLFKNDQPRIVVVFDQGQAGSVYLLSNNRVKKTFADEEEARRDATAQALLEELDEIEARLKRDQQEMDKLIKKTIQWRVANFNQYKQFLMRMRMEGRGAQQKQGIQDSQRAAELR